MEATHRIKCHLDSKTISEIKMKHNKALIITCERITIVEFNKVICLKSWAKAWQSEMKSFHMILFRAIKRNLMGDLDLTTYLIIKNLQSKSTPTY
jgi:hypothetical protein